MQAFLPKQKLPAALAVSLILLMLGVGALVLAQDEPAAEPTSEPAADPVSLALEASIAAIKEVRESPLRITRWRYFEDNWSTRASRSLYGSYGIDNCVASTPYALRRADILFGWTIIVDARDGEAYQARVSYDLEEVLLCDEVQVPPQYAAPAPSANAAADEAADAQAVVSGAANQGPGGFALGGHVAHLSAQDAATMRSAGMTWVKKQLRVESGLGAGIAIIDNAKAHGFRVLLGVIGDKNALGGDLSGYSARYAEFVASLASNGADAIEVWNEPNIDREWPQGQINGGNYVQLLRAAYHAIKAANPSTWVISGAPAPTGYSGTGCQAELCNDDVFMQQMAQAGAAQYMDCLGLHYNEGVVGPTRNGGDPRDNYPTRYFNSMLYRGAQYFPNSKVCWTELGYLSGEGMPSGIPARFNWTPADPVTVAEQAQWLGEAARLSRNSGRVSLMIVWNVNFTLWGSDPQAGYAIVRPGGGCPACASLASAMRV